MRRNGASAGEVRPRVYPTGWPRWWSSQNRGEQRRTPGVTAFARAVALVQRAGPAENAVCLCSTPRPRQRRFRRANGHWPAFWPQGQSLRTILLTARLFCSESHEPEAGIVGAGRGLPRTAGRACGYFPPSSIDSRMTSGSRSHNMLDNAEAPKFLYDAFGAERISTPGHASVVRGPRVRHHTGTQPEQLFNDRETNPNPTRYTGHKRDTTRQRTIFPRHGSSSLQRERNDVRLGLLGLTACHRADATARPRASQMSC